MAIFFTSDCHFGAERTLKISKRPFESVPEMDRTMINNWNKTVSNNDTVIVLGDFGDFNYTKFLNGNINLVKGNYSRHISHEYLKQFFDLVYLQDVVTITINYNDIDYKISMTHEPLNFTQEQRNISREKINLFGHIHKLAMVKPYGINVGMDCHYFTPIDMNTVLFYHNNIFDYYDSNVFY